MGPLARLLAPRADLDAGLLGEREGAVPAGRRGVGVVLFLGTWPMNYTLAALGVNVAVLVAVDARPSTPDAASNWARLADEAGITLVHAPGARDLAVLEPGIERASMNVAGLSTRLPK